MPFDQAPEISLEKPDSVRIAGPADSEKLFEFLWHDLHRSNDMGLQRSERKVREQIAGMLNGTTGICGVIDDGDRIVGACGLAASQVWYSEQWLISEVFLVVSPEHRKGTRHGQHLFEFAKWHREDLSRRCGTTFPLEISVFSNRKLEAKSRLWRRFARPVGAMFWVEG